MRVRQALLADVRAIVALYAAQFFPDDPPQQIADRWAAGGKWASVETCAVWLAHLLRRGEGIPLVVDQDGAVIGYAEVFIGQEPAPYGHHINIRTLIAAENNESVQHALLAYIMEMAQVAGCQRVTAPDHAVYAEAGFSRLIARYPVRVATHEGRVFYRALDVDHHDPAMIQQWHMPLGRNHNAREEWEWLNWSLWNGVPALVETEWHVLQIDLTGQPAILHLHESATDEQAVVARLWTKNPMTSNMLTAVLDRTARLGYASLETWVDAPSLTLFDEQDASDEAHWLLSQNVR